MSDEQWALIEDLLPARTHRQGRPFDDARSMVEGIIYRYRCGIARRDVPAVFGPWQTIRGLALSAVGHRHVGHGADPAAGGGRGGGNRCRRRWS
ncbi:transposase [Kutzneria albida]|uniref:transposase n=1 Tax=Kutzneria albida TaxID=43357 RepID=UPI0022875704|nr:transposase [Kutzneria albida]